MAEPETKCVRLTVDGARRSLWCDQCAGYSGWRRPGCPGLPAERPLSKDMPLGTTLRHRSLGVTVELRSRVKSPFYGPMPSWRVDIGYLSDSDVDAPDSPWEIVSPPSTVPVRAEPPLGTCAEDDNEHYIDVRCFTWTPLAATPIGEGEGDDPKLGRFIKRLVAAEAGLRGIAQYHPTWPGQHNNDCPSRQQLIDRAWRALRGERQP